MHALFCSWLEELDVKDAQKPKRKKSDHHATIAKYAKKESSDGAASNETIENTGGIAWRPPNLAWLK